MSASRGVSATAGRSPGARLSAELRSLGPNKIAFMSEAWGSDAVTDGNGCSGAAKLDPPASVFADEDSAAELGAP